jgi:hypothetical protein
MTAAWVAGTTRARALVRRAVGPPVARRLAAAPSVREAVEILLETPYAHDVRASHDLAQAQHAVLATLLWHLRVLAGWLPRDGAETIRVFARWFEIANVDELLARHAAASRDGRDGAHAPGPEASRSFTLGAAATVWPRLRPDAGPAEIRAALAASRWRDPGEDDRRTIQLSMRLSWAAQVAGAAEEAAPWALGGAALLVAAARHAEGRPLPRGLEDRAAALLGRRAVTAPSIADMHQAVPAAARWALADVTGPDDLWRAENRWWDRLERDGYALLAGSGFAPGPVIGAVAVLAADAHRVNAALELAARGGEAHVPA